MGPGRVDELRPPAKAPTPPDPRVKTEWWDIDKVLPHPDNYLLFTKADETEHFSELLESIRREGIRDPLQGFVHGDTLVLLAGHLRLEAARRAGHRQVPVVLKPAFTSKADELRYIVNDNAARRQLGFQDIGVLFQLLKTALLVSRQESRDSAGSSAGSRKITKRVRDEACGLLKVSRDVAEACEVVFTRRGVPDELRVAVRDKRVTPAIAARAVRAASRTEEKNGKGQQSICCDPEHGAIKLLIQRAKAGTLRSKKASRVSKPSQLLDNFCREMASALERYFKGIQGLHEPTTTKQTIAGVGKAYLDQKYYEMFAELEDQSVSHGENGSGNLSPEEGAEGVDSDEPDDDRQCPDLSQVLLFTDHAARGSSTS